jgi:hypothetical protein
VNRELFVEKRVSANDMKRDRRALFKLNGKITELDVFAD